MTFFVELILGVVFGIAITIVYEIGLKLVERIHKKSPALRVKGFHIHHSIFGVALIGVYLFVWVPILLGLGFGIIIQHTRHDKKFTIIDKK